MAKKKALPKLGFLYLDHVLRFFDNSNFKGWPNKIEKVVYHWGNDKKRFIKEVKRKKIDVLIGNIPATAYETFREISRELPEVRFVPSLDAQFANKSKENVTHFCEKHDLPIPKTDIFYEKDEAIAFLEKTTFPKIIKKSYGPSNYGGYFVHKVDDITEAKALLAQKKYYPVYVQEFVPMQADIRVMVVGHRPMCAFWRRPPEGEWLTNTSQGGTMDYQNVPQEALDIAVKASVAANAEYWACDIALGEDGKFRILECATAFAAFPYIRDWIGQYLMSLFSEGKIKNPYIPAFNWEELGKIRSSVLRTMRHITFGEYTPSYDCADSLESMNREMYPLLPVELRLGEEWPSEIWNRQDNYVPRALQSRVVDLHLEHEDVGLEDVESETGSIEIEPQRELSLSQEQLFSFFAGVKGVGPKMRSAILDTLGVKGTSEALMKDPSKLLAVKNVKQKKYEAIMSHWDEFRVTL
ncbi:MAG: ATP-grasp domain-containing protein [Alteromonadaceae bacterium]|nr:ATP-grasp domain-containing protein [Alteromonadaceae bacterium]